MDSIITTWKTSLERLLHFYDTKRGPLYTFFPMLFIVSVMLNIACYWWAMGTAFPELTRGAAGVYYFKIQFPVGILGALFDSLSFFVTVYIIRRALHSRKNWDYLAHLSIDLVIAILATFWVVYVFSLSGWLINLLQNTPQDLVARTDRYEQMLADAVASPTANLRNIYFGLIMGVSAMIPTCTHVLMFLHASLHRVQVLVRDESY